MAPFPLITVIVPVYRSESTLRRCLDSVLAQTFADYEVVIVDDGSPDNAGVIADEYALRYANFRVIHQANAGSMLARRTAITHARTRYVAMLDSDDTYPPDALQVLADYALLHHLDIVCGSYCHIFPDRKQYYGHRKAGLLDAHEYKLELFTAGTITGGAYSLIATDLFRHPDIFDERESRIPCEDILMHLKLSAYVKRVGLLDHCTYNYYYNPGSQSISGTLSHPDYFAQYFSAVRREAVRQGIAEELEMLLRIREVEALTFEVRPRLAGHSWCRQVLAYSMKGMPKRTRLLHALLHTPRLLDVAIKVNHSIKSLHL